MDWYKDGRYTISKTEFYYRSKNQREVEIPAKRWSEWVWASKRSQIGLIHSKMEEKQIEFGSIDWIACVQDSNYAR
jgi:hypothetical protein